MANLAPFLSSPVTLGSLKLRNRNFMSALVRNRGTPIVTVPNDVNELYYTQRTQGGAGLIMTEATLVSQQGTEWSDSPGIWSDEQVDGWKKIVDSVHNNGGAIFSQVWHAGRISHPDMDQQKLSGKPVYAPSAISARGGKFRNLPGMPGYVTPTELPNPWTVIEDFRAAAKNAKRAGFDGVELHSANGYLCHQFIDSTSNRRTDEWGGSVENRARFTLEVIRALIEVYGESRVAAKLSPAGGYNDMGMPLEETLATFTYLIKELVKMKIAFIELVRAAPISSEDADTDPKQPNQGTFHDVLASYGPLVKNSDSATLLVLNFGMQPAEADALIKEGKIDAATFGRPWIANPDLQKRVEAGVPLETKLDYFGFYNFKDDMRVGYTDYPTAT